MEAITYRQIQENLTKNKKFHSNLSELIHGMRLDLIEYIELGQEKICRIYDNPMILHTGDNREQAHKIGVEVDKEILNLDLLYKRDEILEKRAKQNKIDLSMVMQN